MTYDYFQSESPHKRWFRKEQGRFLKRARRKAGLSVLDVACKTGVDIRWVEKGLVNLQLNNLVYLIHLYRISGDEFVAWQFFVGAKIRQISQTKMLH